ncbi:MAG: hypothetical protein WCD76_09280, partial [Pyrinomonadaceae bacterium]
PVKFEGAGQIVEAARASAGGALVIVPRRYAAQITSESQLETRDLGDNGNVALIYVRARN